MQINNKGFIKLPFKHQKLFNGFYSWSSKNIAVITSKLKFINPILIINNKHTLINL